MMVLVYEVVFVVIVYLVLVVVNCVFVVWLVGLNVFG